MNTKGLKLLLIFLVALFVCLSAAFLKIKCDKDAQRFYKQGMSLYSQKKYSDAYYNFKQIKKFANLYQLSLLKQYQCANKLADKKTAHVKLKELLKVLKDENILPYVLYNEAVLSRELNSNSALQSYKKFKFINEKYPKNDFAIASAYKMAKLIEEKDKKPAYEKYVEYLLNTPNGKYSQNALNSIKQLNLHSNKDDLEVIGFAYLSNKQYQEALECYEKTDFSKNWYNLSKCYRGLGRFEEEKQIIIKGLELSVSDVEEKEIDSAIDRLIVVAHADKIQTLQNLYTKYPNSYIFPTVVYKLAESSASIRSIKLYELVVNKYPSSIWASNSLWEVFWYNYGLSRYKLCETLGKKHIALYPNTQDAPRVAYWYARVLLKEKKSQQAKESFHNVINTYPLSYYAFLSAKRLKQSQASKMILKKPIHHYDINSINKTIFKDKLLLTLAEKNDYETIEELKINDEFIKSWVFNKEGNYPQSINIAKNELNAKLNHKEEDQEEDIKINFSNLALKLIYPIVYEDEVNKYAAKFKQSPYLFLSLLREESHFDKNAKSQAGAVGLSQLMRPTANFIEKETVSSEQLLNADENIRIGLKYFSYLVDYFNKNEYLAILAYNAGPGNINKWMNNPLIQSNDIDAFVENIPYLETKNYIKKILSSYWIYLNIYSPRNKK